MLKLLFIPTVENKYEPYLLRKTALFFYTLVLVFVNILPSSISGLVTKAAADSINSETLISYTNKERRFYGLNDLSTSTQLTTAAYAKANDMFEKQYWDHFGPNGETPWQFIRGTGYEYVYAGENLAKGFKSSEGVHQAWMLSPTHRENIVSQDYKEVGIAVVDGSLFGEEVTLVVQMFGNTTTESFKPTVSLSQISSVVDSNISETGEIKSIKITSPKTGQITNDPKITIMGESEGGKGTYELIISDNKEKIGSVKTDSLYWEYTSQKGFSEGSHDLSAMVNSSGGRISDEVVVEVDLTPPQIPAKSITVSRRKIVIGALEMNLTLKVLIDSQVFGVEADQNGNFSMTIPNNIVSIEKASLFASDVAGNTTEVDITESVKKAIDNAVTSNQVLGVSNMFTGLTVKDLINVVVATFVGVLLFIEIIYFRRMGRLHERVYSIFFIGMWWFIALYAVLVGFGGVVNV